MRLPSQIEENAMAVQLNHTIVISRNKGEQFQI